MEQAAREAVYYGTGVVPLGVLMSRWRHDLGLAWPLRRPTPRWPPGGLCPGPPGPFPPSAVLFKRAAAAGERQQRLEPG
eukprot:9795365-Lingulodinium_polyedra.AAC.1